MSQYIAIVRGEGREEYVEKGIRLTNSKDAAEKFKTSVEAKEAAEALVKAVLDREGYPRAFPWITEADAEEAR